jgi:AsmA protein
LIFPDPESLIRRSPGAAPLLKGLNAIKDPKLRGAAQSVLDRITGGGAKPAADPDAAPK